MLIQGIILSASPEETKQGRPYCKVNILTPSKATINVWGASLEFIKIKSGFSADVKENDQGLSCSFSQVTMPSPTEEQLSWIPAPPTEEEWDALVKSLVCKMEFYQCSDKEIEFFEKQSKKLYAVYCVFPAGKSNHHSYAGGLARHTFEILRMYDAIYTTLPFKTNPFIVAISALFHDAAKVNCYNSISFEYTPYGSLINHVAGSATMLSTLMRKEEFPSRLIMFCEHCVLSHHGRLEWGSPVLPSCVEAHVLALLDEMSGHGVQIEDNATSSGSRVPNLGRTVFKY